jgi:hypothetical protein
MTDGWVAVEGREARRVARRTMGTSRSVLHLTRQRASATVAPAISGDGRRQTQLEQVLQRRRRSTVSVRTSDKGAHARIAGEASI